jgi:hypothetical protein
MTTIPKCWGVAAALMWIAFRNDRHCETLQDTPFAGLDGLGTWSAIFQAEDHSIECLTPEKKELKLMKALQSGEARAWAVKNRSGDLVPIGPGEWNYLSSFNGAPQANKRGNSEACSVSDEIATDKSVRRRNKPSPKKNTASKLIHDAFPNGAPSPEKMDNKTLIKRVRERQNEPGRSDISDHTILRAAGRKK